VPVRHWSPRDEDQLWSVAENFDVYVRKLSSCLVGGYQRHTGTDSERDHNGFMKTTLELPDDLMREVRIRAAKENKKLKDVMTELVQRGLATAPDDRTGRHRMQFPILAGGQPAEPGREMTPERVADALLKLDVSSVNHPKVGDE
jgi:hypothetical protein